MDVGIRELKQRLSEFVARAAKGEVIRVTDRGEPRAILGPVPGRPRLEEGIRGGWIRAGSATPAGRVARVKAKLRTERALDDDRGST